MLLLTDEYRRAKRRIFEEWQWDAVLPLSWKLCFVRWQATAIATLALTWLVQIACVTLQSWHMFEAVLSSPAAVLSDPSTDWQPQVGFASVFVEGILGQV